MSKVIAQLRFWRDCRRFSRFRRRRRRRRRSRGHFQRFFLLSSRFFFRRQRGRRVFPFLSPTRKRVSTAFVPGARSTFTSSLSPRRAPRVSSRRERDQKRASSSSSSSSSSESFPLFSKSSGRRRRRVFLEGVLPDFYSSSCGLFFFVFFLSLFSSLFHLSSSQTKKIREKKELFTQKKRFSKSALLLCVRSQNSTTPRENVETTRADVRREGADEQQQPKTTNGDGDAEERHGYVQIDRSRCRSTSLCFFSWSSSTRELFVLTSSSFLFLYVTRARALECYDFTCSWRRRRRDARRVNHSSGIAGA